MATFAVGQAAFSRKDISLEVDIEVWQATTGSHTSDCSMYSPGRYMNHRLRKELPEKGVAFCEVDLCRQECITVYV